MSHQWLSTAHPDPEGKQLKVLQNCHPDSNTAPDWSKKFRALRAKRSGDFHFYHFRGTCLFRQDVGEAVFLRKMTIVLLEIEHFRWGYHTFTYF